MPQFDFTTYSAQIFWFSICFFVLYSFMAKVILPRIRDIISARKNVIDADLSSANNLQDQNNSIKFTTNEVLRDADLRYKAAIDLAVKDASRNKEKLSEEFKIKAEKMVEESYLAIDKMVANSANQSLEAVKKLTQITQNKIFN